ncbi:MAG: TspO/MBR family protein [Halobacteriota archaeon]
MQTTSHKPLYRRQCYIRSMKRSDVIKLIVSVAVPLVAGLGSSVFTINSISTWYAALNKPWFNPPNAVFGPVWTILYILMGLALFLIWRSPRNRTRDIGIALFAAQLIVNVIWTLGFFGLQNIMYGLLTIVPLWILIAATIYQFYKVDRRASYLLVPYILWVTIATALNVSVYLLNR